MSSNTPALLRLARAAIVFADISRMPNDPGTMVSFNAADEELREAACAYRDILDHHDARRVGYGERTVQRG